MKLEDLKASLDKKRQMVDELSRAKQALEVAVNSYAATYEAALTEGWTRAELKNAGVPDATRLQAALEPVKPTARKKKEKTTEPVEDEAVEDVMVDADAEVESSESGENGLPSAGGLAYTSF